MPTDLDYKKIFNESSSGIAVWEVIKNGEDFILKDINKTGAKMTGNSPDQIIGTSILKSFPGIKKMGLFDVFKYVWRTGVSQDQPIHEYKDDNFALWTHNHVVRLDKDLIVSYFTDLSSFKNKEDTLRQAQLKFTTVFNESPIGIALLSMDDTFIEINPSFADILDYEVPELIGKNIKEITYKDDLTKDLDNINKLKAGLSEHYDMDKRYIKKDGSPIWVNLTKTLVKDSEGNPLYFMSQIQDISEDKQREKKLKSTVENLEKMTDLMTGRELKMIELKKEIEQLKQKS